MIDVKILKALQGNARISLSDLSKEVDLSLSAVSERLKKLDASGVIQSYTAVLDARLLGKDLSVLMNIALESTTHTKDFLDFIETENEILECHYITGEYDYVLKITTRSTESLEQIMQRIKGIPGIKRTQTNVILSSPKQRYSVVPVL